MNHGGATYYRYKCRCDICRAGHAAYNKRWRDRHLEQERRKLNERRAANPEPHRAEARRYYAKHREEIRERKRNPSEALKASQRLASIRAKARKRNAPGTVTGIQLKARWAYYGGRCWMCGKPADTWDHVKPLNRGGSNWSSNLRPACLSCNSSKQDRPVF